MLVYKVSLMTMALVGAVMGKPQAQGKSSYCPEHEGTQTYANEDYCDKFYKCVDGELYEETCANGLVYDGHGAIHNHCNYNWAVDCGKRIYDDTAISSAGCLYAYGIYPVGEGCQTTFFKCAEGVAVEHPCPKGQAYSAEHHVCNYPDKVPYCEKQSESVVGFKCPSAHELPPNAVARKFLPYPRFPHPQDKSAYIICVYDQPRIQFCGHDSYFDDQNLNCVYPEYHEDPHHAPPHSGQGQFFG